jgi:hypothetical protein
MKTDITTIPYPPGAPERDGQACAIRMKSKHIRAISSIELKALGEIMKNGREQTVPGEDYRRGNGHWSNPSDRTDWTNERGPSDF